jgi:hypothetical protein
MALLAGAGGGNAEDHEHGAGQGLRPDKTGAEAQGVQPSGWHYRQRRCESERGEARQETVEDHLNRGVEHPAGHVMPAVPADSIVAASVIAELIDTADRLEHAYDREARILASDVPDRVAILRVLEDCPEEMLERRATLLREHDRPKESGIPGNVGAADGPSAHQWTHLCVIGEPEARACRGPCESGRSPPGVPLF